MTEFENKLIIKEEPYKAGLFPIIPRFDKRGSAFILTGGVYNDILVDEHTTTKEIRQGKYTRLVEISTLPYMREIRFNSPSKENAYSFNVYVKAVIQVVDPILLYQNKNLDVDAYFENQFSLDVRKITKGYSILAYDGMDEELTQRLSSYNTVDEATGFTYRISVVDASPGEQAWEYVHQYSKQQLDASLKNNARNLSQSYSNNYEQAVMTEVVEGKISEAEAILQINAYKNENFDSRMQRLEMMRDKGFITDKDAKKYVAPALESISVQKQIEALPNQNEREKDELDNFYTEDEE